MDWNFRWQRARAMSRRQFFASGGVSLGGLALSQLMAAEQAGSIIEPDPLRPMAPRRPPAPAKARAVIYLHMSGAPPGLDLFDYKSELKKLHMQPCPDSLLKNQRFAFIKGVPRMLGSPYDFSQHGQSGGWFSSTIPEMAGVADDLCVIRSMWTDQFNHAPAELFLYTGNMRAGNPSLGSWITYGLGSFNQDLPGFVVLLSGGTDPTGGKSNWSSGFLPGVYQGVQCRTTGEPILYANDPKGMSRDSRRRSLDALRALNEIEAKTFGDPETLTRIEQYELAFRMQASVPETFDIAKEPKEVLDLYGAKPGEGSFANNCLLARRLVERGVRYVQLFDWGWDIHGTGEGDDLMKAFPRKCKDVDRASAALIKDLKQRGLLDEVVVVWGGEFGRTPMNEARNGSTFLGRDHHPHCFSIWMAGGGIKPGQAYGNTDEFGYFVAENKVTVRDLQTTMLHLLGIDAHRFSYRYQGLNQKLIGPTGEGELVKGILT
ncbi:MAG: DUF1501 domain-containing protein [Verrucomicrobia bacterium]|nr:DUF1501 domain-containing protein [Verrucomicrobiota bacterium]